MSPTALLLVLAAAVAHAAWNIIAHGASRTGLPFLWWGAVVSTLVWAVAIPFTGGFGGASAAGFLAGTGVSAVLHIGYMLLLQRGYTAGDLSTVYATARGTGPLLTVIVAILILGEQPAPIALIGVSVIVIGIIAIGLVGRTPTAPTAPTAPRSGTDAGATGPIPNPRRRRLRLDPGICFGLATGVAIAIYTIWDTHALREWNLAPVSFMVGCTALQIPLFTVAVWRRRRELAPTFRAQWGRIVSFGVISPLSYILVLTAVKIAPVSLVAPIREVSVVLVSLFGALVFRERRPVSRVTAAVVVLGGIVLLSLP